MEPVKTSSVTPAVQRQVAVASSIPVVAKSSNTSVQTSLKVSSPSDSSEVEAVNVAKRVMRTHIPATSITYSKPTTGKLFRVKNDLREDKIQRQENGTPKVSSGLNSQIKNSFSEGSPLPMGVRSFMEPRFKADFSNVKVHTSEKSASLNAQLSAKAFTVSNHVFFGKDQFRPEHNEGKELIAHELTHTIQQGAAIQRSEDNIVTQTTSPQIQRLGISDALNYFAERAHNIPGFSMLTFIIGVNPINMQQVPRTPANLFRGIIGFLPGGNLIFEALQNHGIIDRVSNWIMQRFAELGMAAGSFRQALNQFLDSLSWRDIFNLGGVWDRARRIFTDPIDRIISFVRGLVTGIIGFIKEAILRPIARLAEGTRGYDLLKAVLGQDPVTGDPVPRTAETLIGGFMKLIGQEEIWENIKRGNAIARAWAWFQNALNGLMGFVRQIPTLFLNAFRSLEIMDIILVPRAFARIVSVFGSFIGNFLSWAGNTVWNLLEIIFSVVAPAAVPYLQRAAGAFRTILRNPIGFIGNLVRAAVMGFRQFATNFLSHLRNSLIRWLTGALPGVYIPQALNLREIIKFILSVLGLTWQNIRAKLVRAVGETAVRAMETGFDIVLTLVTQGPAAAWDKIREAVSNLQQMVIDGVMDFVKSRIVEAAVTRLLSMLSPAGAFIQAVIAIYNTIMFFVERLRQIAQVAASFIDSIAAIASGVLTAAANRVEQTMAGLLTLVISFLARIAGLGRVSDAVMNIINRVRQPIDRGLDRVVDWIVNMARRLGRFVAQAGVPNDPNERLRLGMQAAVSAVNRFAGRRIGAVVLTPLLAAIKVRYAFQTLEPFTRSGKWWVRGVINPTQEAQGNAEPEGAAGTEERLNANIGDMVMAVLRTAPFRARIEEVTDTTVGNQRIKMVRYKFTSNNEMHGITVRSFNQKIGTEIILINVFRERLMQNRPSYEPGLVERVWDSAKKGGKVFDPNTLRELTWDRSRGREDQWDMGHAPTKEYRLLVDQFIAGTITWEGFIREYNRPSNYRPEGIHENRSRRYEHR